MISEREIKSNFCILESLSGKRDGDSSFYRKFKSNHKNSTLNSAYNDIKYNQSDLKAWRNFETRDIEGAYPSRFKHKSKK